MNAREGGAGGMAVLFLSDDAVGRQAQYVDPPIADEAKVGGRCDGEAGVEEGRVLDAVPVEALGAKLEHGAALGSKPQGGERVCDYLYAYGDMGCAMFSTHRTM